MYNCTEEISIILIKLRTVLLNILHNYQSALCVQMNQQQLKTGKPINGIVHYKHEHMNRVLIPII